MTGKERLLAAFRGEPVDRLPWAPMMVGDYLATLAGFPQGDGPDVDRQQVEFIVDFYAQIGADVVTYNRPGVCRVRSSSGRVKTTTSRSGDTLCSEIATPVGTLSWHRSFSGGYWFVDEPLLKTPADFNVYAYAVEDEIIEPDFEVARMYMEVIGDSGVPFPIAPPPAIKQFLMGRVIDLDDMVYCLADGNADLLSLFEVVHRRNLQWYEIAARSPLPLFQDSGATSTGVMSPQMYIEFCVPCIKEYCDILHAAGKLKLDHSVGEPIAGILDRIPGSGVDGIFGYRPACAGNATVAQIREAWHGRVCLMGGIDTDYLARYCASDVAREAARFISELEPGDRMVLSTSSAAMPGTPPENFRAVGALLPGL
jgi:hypothetical protein